MTESFSYSSANQSALILELNGTSPAPEASCNLSNGTPSDYDPLVRAPQAYIVPLLFAIIFITGLVGNGTLIFTVIRNKDMRNVPNIFIVSLALGDIILLLVSVPFTATIYSFKQWPYGQAMCKLNEFLQSLSCGVSVFTLVALSGDRYFAIMDPMRNHARPPMKRTIIIAASIWFLAFLLAIPEAIGSHVGTHISPDCSGVMEICSAFPPEWGKGYPKFHAIFRLLVYFAIPITIIGAFYVLMARILILSSRNVIGEGQGQANRQIEARKKVARLVLAFVFVFILCWLPRHIYIMWYQFDPSNFNLFWHIFKIMGFCLSFINSCVNPFALYFLSKQFRKYYNRYLFCCTQKKAEKSRHNAHVNEYVSGTGTMYNFQSHPRGNSTTMSYLSPTKQTAC